MEVPGSCAELPLPPDLKDLEMKLGQKPPDGLIRWLRGDPTAHLLRNSPNRGPRHGLGEKIKALKLELSKNVLENIFSEIHEEAFLMGASRFQNPFLKTF